MNEEGKVAEHQPSLRISYEVHPEDCRSADRHSRKRILQKSIPAWASTLSTTFIILTSSIAAAFVSGVAALRNGVESRLLLAALVLFIITFFAMSLWRRFVISRVNRVVAARNSTRCGEKKLSLDSGHLHLTSGAGETRVQLMSVQELICLPDIILIYLDSTENIIIPRRAFAGAEAESSFIARLRNAGAEDSPSSGFSAALGKADIEGQNGSPISGPTAGDKPDGVPGGRRRHTFVSLADGVLANIRNGIRQALFLNADAFRLQATPGAFAALALFDIFLHFLLTVARIGPNGEFTLYPFASAVIHIPLMLLAGLCMARLTGRRELALALPVSWLSIGIPVDLAASLAYSVLENFGTGNTDPHLGSIHFYAFYGWWTLAALAATLRLAGASGARRAGVVTMLAALIVVPLWNMQRGELWREPYDDSGETDYSAAAGEEALYKQPVLLDEALAKLRPGKNGVRNIYFVGFAGYGSQEVFRKEMEVVRLLFRDRFDSAGHSLVMVNSPGTVLRYPIATATALRLALKRVGEVMNRDRDVLFLYLTSHGSSDHRLSVELWPLELREIDPAMLRQMLDESGIRWKVIAVSACYSGGFIEPLKDDGTLVMTASDADSNSFGCSNDSDFTWFGEALFNEELRHTFSFTTAFRRASASIRSREEKEGEKPSNPQMFVGKAIRPVLSGLEARLEKLDRQRKHNLERRDMAVGKEGRYSSLVAERP